MRHGQWFGLVVLLSAGLAPSISAAQCTNIAGDWTGTETGTVTLALMASDGESANETDAVSGSGAVTITQTGVCTFQYLPLATSGSTLVNSNLTASQLAQLVRSVTVSGNNVKETGVFAILNTAAAAQQGLNITGVTGNVEDGSGKIDTSHAPWKMTMTGSADMVVTGNGVSNGQTVTFTLTVTASTTATFTQNNTLALAPPLQTGIAAGLAYAQPFAASGGSGTGYDWCVLSNGACVWEGTPLPVGFSLGEYTGYLISPGDPIAAPGAYPFTVQVKDSAGNSAQVDFTLTIGCAVTFPTQPQYGLQPVSGVQYGLQYMVRQFIAPPNPNNTNSTTRLLDYAQACGYLQFNWQQQWTALPTVSGLVPAVPSLVPNNVYPASCSTIPASQWPNSCYLVAGPALDTGNAQDYPNLFDPPQGSYLSSKAPSGYDPFPFYYPLNEIQPGVAACTIPQQNGVSQCPSFPYVLSPDGVTLSFLDDPAIKGLPNQPASFLPPPGHYVSFVTSLVGVSGQPTPGSSICGSDSILYCTTLYSWTWNSTFNGTAGGVSQSASFAPIDPGSGTGEVLVTSINGIPTPVVAVTPSANSVSPSDSLSVSVQMIPLSGNALLIGSIQLSSGIYQSLAPHVGTAGATFKVPLNYLVPGANTFTALFTPDPVSVPSYSQAWGTAVVTLSSSLPAPTVTVTPASNTILSALPLSVNVSVSGGSGSPTPSGTVTLSGGGYSSPVSTLVAGVVTIAVPANSLSPGSDVLTVQYSPDAGSSTTYSPATGTSVPVSVALSPAAAMPTFSPAGGNYASPVSVVISTATQGASIYFTTDGTSPTIHSTQASGAITVSVSETLKAIAAGSGYSPSPVANATYTIGSSTGVFILASFDGTDGAEPFANTPEQGIDGNFYGTTVLDGAHQGGTVFKVTPDGTLSTVYSFCSQPNCSDGSGSFTGLSLASNGLLYGALTYSGPNSCQENTQTLGCGKIFSIAPDGTYNSVYSFKGTDGAAPAGRLVQGLDGSLYGSTIFGGSAKSGTIFKITPSGSLTTLYTFCTQANCPDGSAPQSLVMGSDGNFYGSTLGGGTNDTGTLFKITPGGTLTTLYHFCSQPSCSDGDGMYGALLQGADGNFYGTAALGGIGSAPPCDNGGGVGFGTVFKLTPDGTFTVLHSFDNSDGATPDAGLAQGTDGNLYGTTACGGTNGAGTIFTITPNGNLTTLYNFSGPPQLGAGTQGGLLQSTNGIFYTTSPKGGATGQGSVLEVSLGLAPFVKMVPAYGLVGSSVLILGNHLTGATAVDFNGTAAAYTVLSDTEIQATVPAGATTGPVNVTAPSGKLSSYPAFEVFSQGQFPPAATPAFSPSAGTYTGTVNVTISDSTANSTIYYTTDGTTPTTGSTQYTAQLAISSSTTVKAVAVASGYSMSAVSTVSYTINPPPDFSVSGTNVTVTAGATTGNTSTITITSTGGFTGTVTLSAVLATSPANAVNLPTLDFGASNKVIISSSTAQTATLTISTTPATQSASMPLQRGIKGWRAASGIVLACAFLCGMVAARRRWMALALGVLFSIVLAAGISACGGGGGNCGSCGSSPGTTRGSYTITVTAVSGSTKTATVNLTVQ